MSLEGIWVCRGAPTINHLQFVDDSLTFYKANSSTSLRLLDFLNTYARAFG